MNANVTPAEQAARGRRAWIAGVVLVAVGVVLAILGVVFLEPFDSWLVGLGAPPRRAEVLVPLVGLTFGIVAAVFFQVALGIGRRRRRDAGEQAVGWTIGMVALGVLMALVAVYMVLLVVALLFAG